MKKIVSFLVALLILFALIGCRSKTIVPDLNSEDSADLPQKNGTLMVNGHTLSEENYVYLDHEQKTVLLPFIAVLDSLGATIKWKSETVATVKYEKQMFTLNTEDDGFITHDFYDLFRLVGETPTGIWFDFVCAKNDYIVDVRIAWYSLYFIFGVQIHVDYEQSIVSIEKSSDDGAYDDGVAYTIVSGQNNQGFYGDNDTVRCPWLIPKDQDEIGIYDGINDFIHFLAAQRLSDFQRKAWWGNLSVDYEVTYYDNEMISIMFEGTIERRNGIEKVAFPVCFDIEHDVEFEPLELISIDESFLTSFRSAIKSINDDVTTQIQEYTDSELKEIIRQSTAAFTEDGVSVVLFKDDQYTIVSVPCEWEYDVRMLKDLVEIKYGEKNLGDTDWDAFKEDNDQLIYSDAVVTDASAAKDIATVIYKHTSLCNEEHPSIQKVSQNGNEWTVAFENGQVQFDGIQLDNIKIMDATGQTYTGTLITDMDTAIEFASTVYRQLSMYHELTVPEFVAYDKQNGLWQVAFYGLHSEFVTTAGWGIVFHEKDGKILCIYRGA